MMTMKARKQHWESVYTRKPADTVSWYQARARVSMELIQEHAAPGAAVIDVGGGASVLIDDLVAAGYPRPTVLDLSGTALDASRKRLGEQAACVRWIEADITAATLPAATFDVWHDRAVFHFLASAGERADYIEQMHNALRPDAIVVMGTFAADGPDHCSGLPVRRYSAQQLADELGAGFAMMDARREDHRTPGGSIQRFQYAVFRKFD